MDSRHRMGRIRDRLGSFRTRLRLFFVLIVLLPMVLVTIIVFRLIAVSENGQADARIAARQEAAVSLYYNARDEADRVATRIGRDEELSVAFRRGDRRGMQRALGRLLNATEAVRIVLRRGQTVLAHAGTAQAVFPVTREVVAGSAPPAELQLSAIAAADYAKLVRRVTGLDVVVAGGGITAATLPAAAKVPVPATGDKTEIDGEKYRTASFVTPGFAGQQTRVALLEPDARTADRIRHGDLLAGIVLAVFFLLAMLAALLVTRSLQRQIAGFLEAARRLGSGDFSTEVATRGNDEFAELGQQFNKMARELQLREEQLAREQVRVGQSIRDLGETFASNLDRDALIEILVRTAVDAVHADGGRALLLPSPEEGGRPQPFAAIGTENGPPEVARAAEEEVLAQDAASFLELDGIQALAHPLRAGSAATASGAVRVTGVVTVWRAEGAFTEPERELFHYLTAQAALSLENVSVHKTVERQALTDELTGLSNRRRFEEVLDTEVERARRYEQDLALVMLDIDDFKAVNDTHGHQQGDEVLAEVAAILQDCLREVDVPARYGGEELAAVLPGTDIEGAELLAERVRETIESARFPLDDGHDALAVTASFGIAAFPAAGADARSLVAAADGALYAAKRAGKNRTVRAR